MQSKESRQNGEDSDHSSLDDDDDIDSDDERFRTDNNPDDVITGFVDSFRPHQKQNKNV
jgi:hypothetical protein